MPSTRRTRTPVNIYYDCDYDYCRLGYDIV